MKTFLKTFICLTLITAFLFTGCEKNDWQTISCDILVYEGNVFRDGDTLGYGESRDIDGYQNISFKLPKEYYQTENTGDYETEKTWTDGNTTIAIFGVKLVESGEYFEYEEFAHKTGASTTSGWEKERTVLSNGVINSHYPTTETEESITYTHLVDTTLGEYVIRFRVYEHCPKDSPAISEETKKFIQTIADSFECNAEIVLNKTPSISPEDLALAEKAAVDFGKLHNVGVWDSAEDIPVHMYLAWYRDYINSVTSVEERMERYTLEKYPNGFVYPQEDFEAFVQKCFDVSTEYLRSYDGYYAEGELYHLEGGGNNLNYRVRLDEKPLIAEGDIVHINMQLSWSGFFDDTEYRTLIVQKTDDGVKYLRCFAYGGRAIFSGFSLFIPNGYTTENNTIFRGSVDMIKVIDVYPDSERDEIFANADKEYKESEFFVSQSEYSSSTLSWRYYSMQFPSEDDAFQIADNISYYFLEYKDMIIKMETRPVIYGLGGSQREKIENILKTIE